MTTLVFPGQGSQYLGMSRDFYENFKIAKESPPENLSRKDIRLTVDNPEDLVVCRAIFHAFRQFVESKWTLDTVSGSFRWFYAFQTLPKCF